MKAVFIAGYDHFIQQRDSQEKLREEGPKLDNAWHRYTRSYFESWTVSLKLATMVIQRGFSPNNFHRILSFILDQEPLKELRVQRSQEELRMVKENPQGCFFDGSDNNIITLDNMQELGHLIVTALSKGYEVPKDPRTNYIHYSLTLGLYPRKSVQPATPALLGTVPRGRRKLSKEDLAELDIKTSEYLLRYQGQESIWTMKSDVVIHLETVVNSHDF